MVYNIYTYICIYRCNKVGHVWSVWVTYRTKPAILHLCLYMCVCVWEGWRVDESVDDDISPPCCACIRGAQPLYIHICVYFAPAHSDGAALLSVGRKATAGSTQTIRVWQHRSHTDQPFVWKNDSDMKRKFSNINYNTKTTHPPSASIISHHFALYIL